MSDPTNFSQVRCREMAATQRLMMEMPENQCGLVTRCATIAACDYDGTMKLHDLINIIMGKEDESNHKDGNIF